METVQRIRLCRFIEKMEKQEPYCKRLGIENVSRLHGKCIKKEKNKCSN